MKRLFLSIQKVEFGRYLLPALLFGISLGAFVHGYWLIDIFPIDGRSLLFSTILISLAGTVGYILLLSMVERAFSGFHPSQGVGMVVSSLLVGLFLFFTVTDQWREPNRYISLFLPKHTLEISIPPEANTDQVSISWITTSLGDVSYDTIEYKGWSLKGDHLILTDPSNNHFQWVGKTGADIQVVFQSPRKSGYAVLSWDGQDETLKFSGKKNTLVHTFQVPFYATGSMTLLLGLLNFGLLSIPLCIVVWRKRTEILQPVLDGFSPASQKIVAREWKVVLAILALALVLRVPNLQILFPSVEEYSHINAAKQIIQGASMESVYQRGMWLVTLPVSLMFRIFGYELWAARLLGVIFNALAIIPLYLIARKISRPVAILSILLFATSPWIIAVSRVVREYAYYPFYYGWVIYGMILFLEQIPDRFRIDRDWRTILRPKVLLLGALLILPTSYALDLDRLSTFKLILIAYAALGILLFLKLDLGYWKNLIVVLPMIGVVLESASRWHARFPVHFAVNLVPLKYFFPNPIQQWYFDRVFPIPLIGLLGVIVLGVLVRRVNSTPLFLLTIFSGYLAFFIFSANRFFAPRHLSTAQVWYVILVSFGLYLVWVFLQTFSRMRKGYARVAMIIVLGILVVNVQQIILPATSRGPAMPITEDYHNDLTELQNYMLANVKRDDVLITSRIYGRYVEWVDEPDFKQIYDFQVQSTENDVLSIVGQNNSGWIIIDTARIERATFSPEDAFQADDRIEYIGLFDDEHVWRWGVQ